MLLRPASTSRAPQRCRLPRAGVAGEALAAAPVSSSPRLLRRGRCGLRSVADRIGTPARVAQPQGGSRRRGLPSVVGAADHGGAVAASRAMSRSRLDAVNDAGGGAQEPGALEQFIGVQPVLRRRFRRARGAARCMDVAARGARARRRRSPIQLADRLERCGAATPTWTRGVPATDARNASTRSEEGLRRGRRSVAGPRPREGPAVSSAHGVGGGDQHDLQTLSSAASISGVPSRSARRRGRRRAGGGRSGTRRPRRAGVRHLPIGARPASRMCRGRACGRWRNISVRQLQKVVGPVRSRCRALARARAGRSGTRGCCALTIAGTVTFIGIAVSTAHRRARARAGRR